MKIHKYDFVEILEGSEDGNFGQANGFSPGEIMSVSGFRNDKVVVSEGFSRGSSCFYIHEVLPEQVKVVAPEQLNRQQLIYQIHKGHLGKVPEALMREAVQVMFSDFPKLRVGLHFKCQGVNGRITRLFGGHRFQAIFESELPSIDKSHYCDGNSKFLILNSIDNQIERIPVSELPIAFLFGALRYGDYTNIDDSLLRKLHSFIYLVD